MVTLCHPFNAKRSSCHRHRPLLPAAPSSRRIHPNVSCSSSLFADQGCFSGTFRLAFFLPDGMMTNNIFYLASAASMTAVRMAHDIFT
jgi:hypothetical protein